MSQKDANSIQNPHDNFFWASLCQTEIAQAVFQAHLPAALQSRIDWSKLSIRPNRYVGKRYQNHYTDLLYSVKLKDTGESSDDHSTTARSSAEQRGMQQGVQKTAYDMLRDGLEPERVARITHLPISEIEKLKK